MINDAEEGSMNNGQLTANSIAFANQLKARGFTNVLHYSMAPTVYRRSFIAYTTRD